MANDVDEGKLCAILMWLFPIGLIWWLVDEKMKKNKFAKYHLKQSLVLVIASVIINVVGMVVPIIGWFVILPIGGLLVFILWIIGLIKAITGKSEPLPVLGQFADKFNF